MRNLLTIGLFLAAAAQALAAGNYIWIEGESATNTNMKPDAWYAGSVAKSKLSGAAFISNYGPEEGFATYDFNAVTPGDYTLWIRANPIGAPQLDYKLNAKDWIPVDFKNFVDLVNIAADGKPDLRFIAWIKVGTVNVDAGANRIAFRFHSRNNNHGSLDCSCSSGDPSSRAVTQNREKGLDRMKRDGGRLNPVLNRSGKTRSSTSVT